MVGVVTFGCLIRQPPSAKHRHEATLVTHNLHSPLQQGRFQAMSDAIISRIDEMGARVDDLEKSITELMTNAGQAAGGSVTGAAAPAK